MTAADIRTGRVVAPPNERARWLRLLRLDLRRITRGAAILGALTAGFTALVVRVYPSTVASPQDAAALELVAHNPAIRLLFGIPRALDTAGGFTVWRTGTIAAVAIAAWALATATRLTRGEEDSGRSWLLHSAPVPIPTTVVAHLTTIVAVVTAIGAATAVAMVAAGATPEGALIYTAGLVAVGWFFTAIGASASQLLGERSQAGGLAAGLLVAALMTRMVGDGLESVGWIGWLTPFGLLSLSAPYTGNHWLPIVALIAASLAAATLAVYLAGHRDLGAGLIAVRGTRAARTRLLSSPVGFATRRTLPSLLGWGAAIVGYFLLIGLLAVSLTEFLTANPRFAELAAAAGFGDLVRVEGYVAALFKLLPIPLGLYAAVRIARLAAAETRGQLTLLFSTPVRRVAWPLSEAFVVTVACLLLAAVTAVSAWIGTTIVAADLTLGDAFAGTANVLPVVFLSVGAAIVAWGWWPRAVLPIGALPTVGGFIWWVVAESLDWSERVQAISPYPHLASVPANPPNLLAAATMTGVAAALLLGGLIGFSRRDLRT
ncbi:ABC transporter permease [Microlunatus ginsengisoli]|uniref:Exporter of polyketide antibiotics n=1 Tax=Microlunatus ginsengisoli TaxID=363863 RepID=A0ABP6ZF64_9ACTN